MPTALALALALALAPNSSGWRVGASLFSGRCWAFPIQLGVAEVV